MGVKTVLGSCSTEVMTCLQNFNVTDWDSYPDYQLVKVRLLKHCG